MLFRSFVGTGAIESSPAFSPDGRWIAYMSDETGTPEIYVRPFGRPGGRWQISRGRGTFPYWSKRGEMFYRGAGIMVVPYSAHGESFIPGKPRRWSNVVLPSLGIGTVSPWDLASDGKRAVAILPDSGEGFPPAKLSFLMNFLDEVQRRTSK